MTLKGIIVSPDGTVSIEDEVIKRITCDEDCEQVGIELGDKLKQKVPKKYWIRLI